MADINGICSATVGSLMLLMSGGMHIGWSSFNVILAEVWKVNLDDSIVMIAYSTYFIGTFFGIIIGMIFVDLTGRKQTQYAPLVLCLTNGLILSGFSKYPILLMIAEFVGGIGYGITVITFNVKIGEITCKSLRGQVSTWGPLAIMVGVFQFSFIVYFLEYQRMPIFVVGIITIVDSIIATIFIFSSSPESPAYVLQLGRDEESRRILFKLKIEETDKRIESYMVTSSSETMNEFQKRTETIYKDLKEYVFAEPPEKYFNINNVARLVFLILTIINYTLTFNSSLNILILGTFHLANPTINWIYPLLIVTRCIGGVFGLLEIDHIGRKKIIFISGIGSSIMLFSGSLVLLLMKNEGVTPFWIAAGFFIIFYFFAGIGSGVPYALATELFPYKIKSRSIATGLIFDVALQISSVILGFYLRYSIDGASIYVIFMGSASSIIVVTILLTAFLPETKRMTLLDCTKILN